jgi:hypothetical protein
MTDLGTLTVAWKWLEDSELCVGSQLKPFGHAMAWNAFNTDQQDFSDISPKPLVYIPSPHLCPIQKHSLPS